MKDTSSTEISVPIRKLVDFACRTGDLVTAARQGPTAQEGIRAHKKIQRALAPAMAAEVPVDVVLAQDGYRVRLRGRIDLLEADADPPHLIEIKSCYCPEHLIAPAQRQLHWAQLKIYGYCYLTALRTEAQENQAVPDSLVLSLLWYDLTSKHRHWEKREFGFRELQSFCTGALKLYLAWHHRLQLDKQETRASALQLGFPYGRFRAGQREMAKAVYRAARDSEVLLCEAPTGIGKTASTLFPAIKALAEGHLDKIVYLTAKNSGRQVAMETIDAMQQAGLKVSCLLMRAKKTTCHCQTGVCETISNENAGGICPLTLGFYDRLPAARQALLEQRTITPEVLDKVAQHHQLCPFELSLQMLPWVTIVICDYNYVFDPLVSLAALADDNDNTRTGLLVDEVHNLPDRSREMYSATLSRSQLQSAIGESKPAHPEIARELAAVSRAIDRWSRQVESAESVSTGAPATVTRAVNRFAQFLSNRAQQNRPVPGVLAECITALYRYLVVAELYADQHRTVTHVKRKVRYPEVTVRLTCLDASGHLRDAYSRFAMRVFFSATLRPPAFYAEALGLGELYRQLALPSPFAAEHLGSFLCPFVDTRYRCREQSLDSIAVLIHRVVSVRSGNYLVFFPSYDYMQQVAETYRNRYPLQQILMQERAVSEEERAEYLAHFKSAGDTLGFAIMGGIYGEAVDFPGEQLVGAIIIGVGLPANSIEQELIKDYYRSDNRSFAGGDDAAAYDRAYRYPGFTRVLQTAGRVIRGESDRGVIVLVEQRFNQRFYKDLFPQHWKRRQCRSMDELSRRLSQFWEERDGKQAVTVPTRNKPVPGV